MDTNELKAAIERVREGLRVGVSPTMARQFSADLTTVLALAEIGRLAVEVHQHTKGTDPLATHAAADLLDDACTAFLARLEGGK